MRAAYSISIDGVDVSANFGPVLESLSLTDSDGGKSDTLEIVLNDQYGQLLLPRTGALIQAAIWWEEVPSFSVPGSITFSGKTDAPKSQGARRKGMTLSISAKSADVAGKGKEKKHRYKDDAKFSDVAQAWGSEAGYQVQIDQALGSINRNYWHMSNESFLNWGRRIAEEIGATFKVAYPNAVFVPRNSGSSASGQALAPFVVTRPGNLVSWDLTPTQGQGVYANAKATYYDAAAGLWKTVSAATGIAGAEADHTETYKHADATRAQAKATNNADQSKRKSGGGSIDTYGDPRARSQNSCTVSGIRDGVDGEYRIKTVHHTYVRGGGWGCSTTVEQPQGSAGTDSRAKSSSGSGAASSPAASSGGTQEAGAVTGGSNVG